MMVAMELSQIKKNLLEQRTVLAKEFIKDKSIRMMKDIVNDKRYQEAKTIYIYMPSHNEIDTEYLMIKALQDGKKVAAPVVMTSGDMFFENISGNPGFHKSRHDFLQPNIDPKLIVDEPGLMIVPLYGCHEKTALSVASRYYGNYLLNRKSNLYTIGVGYDFQEVDSAFAEDVETIELDEVRVY